MFFRLLLLFTLIPLIELYILIKVGGMIGAFNTILIIVITGILGAYLARSQGFKVIQKINLAMEQGRTPAQELLEGLFILIGGFTLLTPGFVTDLMGLSMLLPLTRAFYIKIAAQLIQNKINTGQWFPYRY
ncbi:MAG: membrane protein FxsA [Candidatus Aminicenantes bacterium]|nr:membrane protein FxsA [Candidatus Aminicenantes bacterium]